DSAACLIHFFLKTGSLILQFGLNALRIVVASPALLGTQDRRFQSLKRSRSKPPAIIVPPLIAEFLGGMEPVGIGSRFHEGKRRLGPSVLQRDQFPIAGFAEEDRRLPSVPVVCRPAIHARPDEGGQFADGDAAVA